MAKRSMWRTGPRCEEERLWGTVQNRIRRGPPAHPCPKGLVCSRGVRSKAPPEPALSEVEALSAASEPRAEIPSGARALSKGTTESSPARPGSPARPHLARWGGSVPGQRWRINSSPVGTAEEIIGMVSRPCRTDRFLITLSRHCVPGYIQPRRAALDGAPHLPAVGRCGCFPLVPVSGCDMNRRQPFGPLRCHARGEPKKAHICQNRADVGHRREQIPYVGYQPYPDVPNAEQTAE